MAVKWKGMNELKSALKSMANPEAIKKVVKMNGAELQERMQRQTYKSFRKGYSIGDTRKSIRLQITDGGMTAEVEPTTGYSPYVEYGTRYMEAEPFVAPAFREQEPIFLRDLGKLTK